MSSGDNRRPGRRDLRAAIQWDVPTLRASRTSSVDSFLHAMYFRLPDVAVAPAGDDPLVDAVVGLAKEFSGDRDGARAVYRFMQANAYRDVGDLAHLLATALLAWTAPADVPALLEDAAAAVAEVDGATFRTNYLLKLAGFALNVGDRERARSLAEQARTETVPSSRRLRWRTEVLLARLDGGFLLRRAPLPLDRFADFPWIIAEGAQAAQQALVRTAEDRASNPWARTVHFGLTPTDRAAAAVIQAEWAGALWLLPELRLQNAAQILVQGGRNPSEWVECAADWVLGGGRQLSKILDHVEAHFDDRSATLLLADRLRDGSRLDNPERIASVLAELWDLLSPDEARTCLERLDPPVEDVPLADDLRRVWGVLGAIIPAEWSRRFLNLDRSQQLTLLGYLPTGVIPGLPVEVHSALVSLFLEAVDSEAALMAHSRPWKLGAALTERGDPDEVGLLLDRLREAPESDRLAIAASLPAHVDALNLAPPVEAARQELSARADAARKGQMSIGGRSPAARLALGLRINPNHPEAAEILRELVAVAADPEVLVDVRVEALHGLRYVAQSLGQLIDLSPLRVLRFVDRPDFGMTSMTPDVAQALATCITLVADRSHSEPGLLASFARSDDERIRELAVETTGDLLEAGPDELIQATLLGALYDPSRTVVIAALRSLERTDLASSALAGPFTQRIMSLFQSGTRAVRSTIAQLVAATDAEADVGPSAEPLLAAARSDRSWQVRHAAGV